MVQLVFAFGNNLVGVDPHVAIAGQHIHVRLGLPVRMGLAAVRIAERNVYAGKFLVLEQNANHFR